MSTHVYTYSTRKLMQTADKTYVNFMPLEQTIPFTWSCLIGLYWSLGGESRCQNKYLVSNSQYEPDFASRFLKWGTQSSPPLPEATYMLAMPMLSGLGGGMSKHTEGISMSRPPGPVTSHLLRWELSFRMPSFPFKIPLWKHTQHAREYTMEALKHIPDLPLETIGMKVCLSLQYIIELWSPHNLVWTLYSAKGGRLT